MSLEQNDTEPTINVAKLREYLIRNIGYLEKQMVTNPLSRCQYFGHKQGLEQILNDWCSE